MPKTNPYSLPKGDLVVMSIKTYELLTKTSDINDTVSSHKNKIDNEEALFDDKDA